MTAERVFESWQDVMAAVAAFRVAGDRAAPTLAIAPHLRAVDRAWQFQPPGEPPFLFLNDRGGATSAAAVGADFFMVTMPFAGEA